MMDGVTENRKGKSCRYCLKVLSARRISEHQRKCRAANFPIPHGYTVEKLESGVLYSCPCGFNGRRYQVFDHMPKCLAAMADKTAKK
jgi:hypothetical protein